MKISDLKSGQGKVDIEATIKSVEQPRVLNRYGRELKVANAIAQDDSGEIKLTLWNQDIDKVQVGSKIKITNGYVSEFQGEKQLTSGKFGKLEVIDSSASTSQQPATQSSQPAQEDLATQPTKEQENPAEKKEEAKAEPEKPAKSSKSKKKAISEEEMAM